MKAIKRQTLEALTRIPICRSQIIVCCFQVLPPVGIAACVRTELCQQMLQYNFPHPTFTLNHCTQSQKGGLEHCLQVIAELFIHILHN